MYPLKSCTSTVLFPVGLWPTFIDEANEGIVWGVYIIYVPRYLQIIDETCGTKLISLTEFEWIRETYGAGVTECALTPLDHCYIMIGP